jgi:Fe2+ or Zn2+ uptake regulation protein
VRNNAQAEDYPAELAVEAIALEQHLELELREHEHTPIIICAECGEVLGEVEP